MALAAAPGNVAAVELQRILSRSMTGLRQSTLREVMAQAAAPDVLSFALGMPAPELLPAAEIERATRRVLENSAHLQYALPLPALKEWLVELMARRGVRCRPSQIFLTTGAQQGISLVAQLLLDPGGPLLVEETVYDGIRLATRILEPEVRTVPTDPRRGIDVDAVEAVLESGFRPALLYLITDGHNPLGVSLSEDRRRRLAELARRYGVTLLEDDAYGFLSYEGPAPPLIHAFDPEWVLYLGSFSKVLAPALRVGWLVVPEDLVPRLSALKHGNDCDTATLSQRIVAEHLSRGDFPLHLHRLREEYRHRRDTLLAALERHFHGPGAGRLARATRWNRPSAGMFVWAELPSSVDVARLLELAIRDERVAFSPGQAFAMGEGEAGLHAARLSFATLSPDRIDEGVARLARALARYDSG